MSDDHDLEKSGAELALKELIQEIEQHHRKQRKNEELYYQQKQKYMRWAFIAAALFLITWTALGIYGIHRLDAINFFNNLMQSML